MNYEEDLLRSKISEDLKNKYKEDCNDLVMTVINLNFLGLMEKYNLNLDDIYKNLNGNKEVEDKFKLNLLNKIKNLLKMDNKTLSEHELTLTKFEKVRVIGQRAMQLSLGAPPLVDITGMQDAISIAEKELKENKIPIIIRRTYPNGETKEFDVSDMNSTF